MTQAHVRPALRELTKISIAIVITGVAAGLSVLALVAVIHGIESWLYGPKGGPYLDDRPMPPRWLPLFTMMGAGVLAGCGWYALRRWGRKIRSVDEGVDGKKMPMPETIVDVLLQVVTVALGSSIGKEVAPRELAAMVTSKLTSGLGLDARWRRVFVAAAAGAGLAAVYNVPFGGALFALEILLVEFDVWSAIVALAVSSIAVLVSRPLVPDESLYSVPHVKVTASVIVAAIVIGPVLGVIATSFMQLTRRLGQMRPTGARLLWVMPAVYTIVGLVGVAFPLMLGNGWALAQAGFDVSRPALILLVLALLKFVATSSIIGSGAVGGTLQPSVAIGSALGAASAIAWAQLWPGASPTALAIVGAAAFLSSSMRAPLTAIALVVEFTGSSPEMFVPIFLSVAGALAASSLWGHGGLRQLLPIDPSRE